MGNRVVKARPRIEHFVASEFLQSRIWNDGYNFFYKNKHLEKEIKFICNTSCNQLSRVNKSLTKTDLIAILIKINPTYKYACYDMHKYLSINDLNYIIRHEVYSNCVKDVLDKK